MASPPLRKNSFSHRSACYRRPIYLKILHQSCRAPEIGWKKHFATDKDGDLAMRERSFRTRASRCTGFQAPGTDSNGRWDSTVAARGRTRCQICRVAGGPGFMRGTPRRQKVDVTLFTFNCLSISKKCSYSENVQASPRYSFETFDTFPQLYYIIPEASDFLNCIT